MSRKPWKWWTDNIAEVSGYLEKGWTFKQIGNEFGVSRSAVASVKRRYIRKVPDDRYRRGGTSHIPIGGWTEEVLTETWAERKRRRKDERKIRQAGSN